MSKKLKYKSTILKKTKVIVLISLVFIVFTMTINFFVLKYMREQTKSYINNTALIYIKEADKNFFKIGRRIVLLFMSERNTNHDIVTYLNIIQENNNSLKVKVAIQQLKERFFEYSWEYGPDYKFFTYFKDRKYFLKLSYLDGESLKEDKAIQLKLVQLIETGRAEIYSVKKQWDVFSTDKDHYLVKIMKSNGKYLGCYIKVENLLKIFKEIEVKNGTYVLVNNSNNVISYYGSSENISVSSKNGNKNRGLFSNIVLNKSFSRIPYSIRIIIDNYSLFEGAMVVQILIILVIIILLLTQMFTLFYIIKHILNPIKKFTFNLIKYDKDNDALNFTDNEIKELQDANELFRSLLVQIKKLKITLYEEKIEKQKIKMDYLQLQIKPHFYLNCMNLIYQMVEMNLMDDAKKMLRMVSDYLRYLFKSDLDFVLLKEEINHVVEYLEIYKMRYNTAFDYEIYIADEVKLQTIPPLMIHTFIENSIKHIVTLDSVVKIRIDISLVVLRGKKNVRIFIHDTGSGFPENILEMLNNKQRIQQQDGTKVGITNCLDRIKYFYKNTGNIKFYNCKNGGAVVEITIPFVGV